jgi:cytochrome c6
MRRRLAGVTSRRRFAGVRGALAALLALCAGAAAMAQAQAQAQAAPGGEAETLALGRRLFTAEAQPSCTVCHVLKDAGSTAEVGPPLDELKPDAGRVARALRNGIGVMPSFRDKLTEAQIEALARYVAHATGAAR